MKLRQLLTLSLVILALARGASGKIIYVDDDAIGANNGSSWENAYKFLQDALADANSSEKPVEIRVAQGVYKPDQGENHTLGDREATFQLINGVTLKGSYAGLDEADPNARDFNSHDTILSGDLQSNDIPLPLESFFACFTGPLMHLEIGCETFDFDGDNDIDDSDLTVLVDAHNYGENSYHVVTCSGKDPNAVIDGFTITSGNAEPYFPDEPMPYEPMGGGMYNFLGSPEVLNCTFRGNLAGNGGGMYNIGSNPKLFNCTFYKNIARFITQQGGDAIPIYYGLGGALHDTGSSSVLIDCGFIGNAAYSGGGMHNQASFPMLTNCIFEINHAQSRGGGISNHGSDPTLKNCIFLANKAQEGAGIENNHGGPKLNECMFSQNIAERAGGGTANYYSNPVLVGCIFIGNQANNSGGGMYNWQSNPVMNNCVFSGNSTTRDGGGIYVYLNSNPTLVNCTFVGNWGENGNALACFSNFHKSPSVIEIENCILWNGVNEIHNDDNSSITITYSDIQGGWEGQGNIDTDPWFVNPGRWADANDTSVIVEPNDPNAVWIDGDYHLKSQAGRWDPSSESWTRDDVTSPCIDTGDPDSPIGHEPFPNGGIVNIGAYGGTAEASKSYFGEPICGTIIVGDINGDCKVDLSDFAIMALHWLEDNNP